jgi:hypothetical protein
MTPTGSNDLFYLDDPDYMVGDVVFTAEFEQLTIPFEMGEPKKKSLDSVIKAEINGRKSKSRGTTGSLF